MAEDKFDPIIIPQVDPRDTILGLSRNSKVAFFSWTNFQHALMHTLNAACTEYDIPLTSSDSVYTCSPSLEPGAALRGVPGFVGVPTKWVSAFLKGHYKGGNAGVAEAVVGEPMRTWYGSHLAVRFRGGGKSQIFMGIVLPRTEERGAKPDVPTLFPCGADLRMVQAADVMNLGPTY